MRRIFSVLLALMLCMSLVLCVNAREYLVYDEADLLTDAEETGLQAQLESVSREHNAQIVVVTVDKMDGYDIDTYVNKLYDYLQIGYGADRDGVLLLVCMGTRQYRILSNGSAGTAIRDREIESIGSTIESDLSDANYAEAFCVFADRCAYYLDGYTNGYPFEAGKKLLIAVVIGLVIGLVVALILKGQLRSVRPQNRANAYIKDGSMRVTVARDIFLYRNLSRTKKQTSNSSGGRSSRSVGGGSF